MMYWKKLFSNQLEIIVTNFEGNLGKFFHFRISSIIFKKILQTEIRMNTTFYLFLCVYVCVGLGMSGELHR